MEEKRKHKRIYFSVDEDFFVEIESKSTVRGRLLSLSEGGISFFVPIEESPSYKKEDLIFLSSLKSEKEVIIDSLVFMSVRYAFEDRESKKVIYGCKFLDLSDEDREKIKKLIERKAEEFPI